jgi:hypothetical protein
MVTPRKGFLSCLTRPDSGNERPAGSVMHRRIRRFWKAGTSIYTAFRMSGMVKGFGCRPMVTYPRAEGRRPKAPQEGTGGRAVSA